jgi:hypothetical protein
MDSDPDSNLPPFVQQAQDQYRKYMRQYQYYLDRTTPHVTQRWLSTVGVYAVFMLRVVFAQGVSLSCFTLGSRSRAHILLVVYWYVAVIIMRA